MQIPPAFHEKWLVSFCMVVHLHFDFNPIKFNSAANHGFDCGHCPASLPRGTDGFLTGLFKDTSRFHHFYRTQRPLEREEV
jgi:hypothetical protein